MLMFNSTHIDSYKTQWPEYQHINTILELVDIIREGPKSTKFDSLLHNPQGICLNNLHKHLTLLGRGLKFGDELPSNVRQEILCFFNEKLSVNSVPISFIYSY